MKLYSNLNQFYNDLVKYYDHLNVPIDSKADTPTLYGEQEFNHLSDYTGPFCHEDLSRGKNRYSNILSNASTTFSLRWSNDSIDRGKTSYINANSVVNPFTQNGTTFLCTQGCTQDTMEDFWHMVFQSDARTIIMLTKDVENGREKCSRYYPSLDVKESNFRIGIYEIQRTDIDLATKNTPWVVTYLTLVNRKTSEKRQVTHIQYLDWKDQSVPSRDSMYQFLHFVEPFLHPNESTIVHCSAGVGRTGCFCALYFLMEIFAHCNFDKPFTFEEVPLIIKGLVEYIRNQRAQSIQTVQQYFFIYEMLLYLLAIKLGIVPNPPPCLVHT